MKIALVDDSLEEIRLLSNFIEKSLPHAIVRTFSSGEEFLDHWTYGEYDLIILDIYMDKLTGIDVARKIRQKNADVRLVFCTTSNEFAGESYELGIHYYLHKPIDETGFTRMLKAIRLSDYEEQKFITLPDGQNIVLRNITYTEYYNHTIIIHSKKRADLQTRMSQTEWERILDEYDFLYSSSKGIVVNFYEVARQEDSMFILTDGSMVPISRRKSKDALEAYATFRFQQMRKGDR